MSSNGSQSQGSTGAASTVKPPESSQLKTPPPKLKVIIDTDPGTDDCHAITMFLKHVKVLAVTTVFGNVTQDMSVRNACRILHYLQKEDVPVYKGTHNALASSATYVHSTAFIHGEDGLNDIEEEIIPCKVSKTPESDMLAPNAIIDIVNKNPGEVVLVAMGPLTNIALALKLDPELPKLVKQVFVMGGSTTKGNVTRWAEFNFHCDPLAADVVLKSFSRHREVNIVPWECCLENSISFEQYNLIFQNKPETSPKLLMHKTGFTPSHRKRKSESPELGYVFADQFLPLALIQPKSVLETEYHDFAVVNYDSEDAQYGLMEFKDFVKGENGDKVGGIRVYKKFDMKGMIDLYCSSIIDGRNVERWQ